MAFAPKSKVPELSGIPWRVCKPRTPKAAIPWRVLEKSSFLNKAAADTLPNAAKLEHLAQGQAAETLALQYLEAQGLILLGRNHRCRCGELDLIMADQATAVIVEVRQRSGSSHGGALESISRHKQARVSRCATLWWIQHGQRKFQYLRFDVIAVENPEQLQWVQNAWQISN